MTLSLRFPAVSRLRSFLFFGFSATIFRASCYATVSRAASTRTPFAKCTALSGPELPSDTSSNGEEFSKQVFEKMNKSPLLGKTAYKDKLLSQVAIFQSLGCAPEQIARMYKFSPNLIYCSDDLLAKKLQFLRGLGLTHRLGYVICSQPSILSLSVDNLKSRAEYLESLGMSKRSISVAIGNAPALICYSLQYKIPTLLNYFKTLGIERDDVITMISHSPSVVGLSLETVMKKMSALQEFGFSREQAITITRKYPFLLNCQVEGEGRLRQRADFILKKLKVSPEQVGAFPSLLGYSYRNRLLFRYEVTQRLGIQMDARYYIKMTEVKFATFLGITLEELQEMSKKFVASCTIELPKALQDKLPEVNKKADIAPDLPMA